MNHAKFEAQFHLINSDELGIKDYEIILEQLETTQTTSILRNLKTLKERLGTVRFYKIETVATKIFTAFKEDLL